MPDTETPAGPEEITPPPDLRPRVPLNGKAVRLDQLAAEVGAALTASETEVVVADPEATVTTTQLRAAIAKHVPIAAADPIAVMVAEVEKATTVAGIKAALVKGLPLALRHGR